MMAKVSVDGLRLVQRFEGLRLSSYLDAVGVWTIGWGHTGQVDGQPLMADMTITREKADALLYLDLKRFEDCVQTSVARNATQDQFDAMVSFAYNVGCGAFKKSTLLKMFNASDDRAASQFARWNRGGGRVLKGLTRRRAVEAAMFRGDDWEKAFREAFAT